MQIKCPYCKYAFVWKPPDDAPVFREMMAAKSHSSIGEKKRYVAKCPNCKKLIDVTI